MKKIMVVVYDESMCADPNTAQIQICKALNEAGVQVERMEMRMLRKSEIQKEAELQIPDFLQKSRR